jgi:hypothetical protein
MLGARRLAAGETEETALRSCRAEDERRERAGALGSLRRCAPDARRLAAAACLVGAALLPGIGAAEEVIDPSSEAESEAPAAGSSSEAGSEALPSLGPPLRAPEPTLRERVVDALEAADGVAAPVFDLIVLRPLGAAAMVVGVPFFVASAPFVGPTGGLPRAFDVFVYAPVDYTLLRPLGEF